MNTAAISYFEPLSEATLVEVRLDGMVKDEVLHEKRL